MYTFIICRHCAMHVGSDRGRRGEHFMGRTKEERRGVKIRLLKVAIVVS
jgi:hypothetical protein